MPTPLILKIEVDDRGTVKVDKITSSFNRLKDATKKADKQTNTFSHTMGAVSGVLGGVTKAVFSLKGALAALGLGYLAKSALSVAGKFEQLQMALDTITKGKGKETFEALNKWAKIMPINTEKAIEAFQMMIAMGLKPTIKDMTLLVDTTAALGGSEDIMISIALALGKIQAKGGATARELLMLSRRGIPILKILREELHDQSIEWDKIATSSYSSNQIIQAILSGLEKRYGGLAYKLTYAWVGFIEFFQSEWKDFVRIVMESGLFDYLKGNLAYIRTKIEEWGASGQIKIWAKDISDTIIDVLKKIKEGIIYLYKHTDDLKKAFKLLLIPIKAFIAFKLGAILTEIGGGVVFAAEKIVHLRSSMELLNIKMSKLSPAAKGGMIGLALFGGWEIGKWLNKFDIVKKWGIALTAGLHKIFLWLEKSLKGIWDLIKFAFDKMIQGIEITLNSLPKSIQFMLNSVIDGINKLLDSMSKLPIIGEKIEGARLGKIEFGRIELKEDYMTFEKVLQNLLKYESDYEKAVRDAKEIWQGMFDEVGNVEKSTNKVTKAVKEVIEEAPKIELPDLGGEAEIEITEMMTAWDKLWEDMNKGFVQGFADMLSGNIRKFSDFMKSLKDIFLQGIAKMASENLIKPIAEVLTSGLKGAISGLAGQLFGKGIGDKKGTGLLGKIGEKIGGLGAGTIAVGAGALYSLSKLFEKDKEPPRIQLEWEINADKFEQVLDIWEGSAVKNTQFLNAMNSNIKELHDLYSTIADFSNTTLNDFKITLDSLSRTGIETQRIGFQFAQANIDLLKKLFGEEVLPTEAMAELEKLEAERLALVEMGPSPKAGYGGALGALKFLSDLEEIEKKQAEILSGFNIQMEDLYANFIAFADEFSKIIGTAFIDSLETREFLDFKMGLRKGIYGSFKSALLQEFTTTALHDVMSTIWESFGMEGWSDIVKDVMAGNTTQALGMIGTMTDAIDRIEPVFNLLVTTMDQMESALGMNTEAIVENNDLLNKQQEIQDFISELTTGQLAPVQSYEAIMGRYQELLGGDNLSELFNFVTGTALPFLQTYGGNYQEAFSGVIEDLRNLSGLYGANISPSAIGEAVAGAIMPALQGGTQTIHVTVEVDGQAIGEVILDQLQTNPQLVQEVKEITQ